MNKTKEKICSYCKNTEENNPHIFRVNELDDLGNQIQICCICMNNLVRGWFIEAQTKAIEMTEKLKKLSVN